MTASSPEAAVLTRPVPPLPLSPRGSFDEFSQMLTIKQCAEDIVISKEEGASVSEYIPANETVSTPPARFPTLPKQVNVHCQLTDENPPKTTLRQQGLRVINTR